MLRYFWELPACRVNENNLNRDMSHQKMLSLWFERDQPINRDIVGIIKGLKEESRPLFEEYLSRILLKTVSYYDLKGDDDKLLPVEKEEVKQENFYHGLMLGLTLFKESCRPRDSQGCRTGL